MFKKGFLFTLILFSSFFITTTSVFAEDPPIDAEEIILYEGGEYIFGTYPPLVYKNPNGWNIVGYSVSGRNGYQGTIQVDFKNSSGNIVKKGFTGFSSLDIKGVTQIVVSSTSPDYVQPSLLKLKIYTDRPFDDSVFTIKNLSTHVTGVDTIALKWDAVNSIHLKQYKVYQGAELVATTNNNSYSISGIVPGREYSFQVTAVDKTDKEYTSLGETVVYTPPIPDTTPPDKPTGLKVNAEYTEAIAKWTASAAEDTAGYDIYLNDNKVNSSLITGTTYTLKDLKQETAYKAYIVAQDKTGNISDKSEVVDFKTKKVVTESEQEQTPEFLLVTWRSTPKAVSYLIYLNGKQVGTAAADETSFKITKDMGYKPNLPFNKTEVKATFADGSTGGGGSSQPPAYNGEGWGFTPGGILESAMFIIASLAGFILLGLVVRLVPKLVEVIKDAATSN